MFTSNGADITLVESQRNPGRMDFVFDESGTNKGNPRFDSTRTHAVLTTVMSRKRGKAPGSKVEEGGYYWDDTGLRGTLVWTVKYDRLATRSQLVAAGEDAGAQLVGDKLLVSLSAEAYRVNNQKGRWRLELAWTLPNSQTQAQSVTV